MELRNDGLVLWFDTPDAPLTARSITVGVRPAHPANTVIIRYRLPGRPPSSVRAVPVAALSGQPTQYFRAALPELPERSGLEVLPELSCSGRQTPAATEVGPTSPYWRRCPAPAPAPARATPTAQVAPAGPGPRFPYHLERLGAVAINLRKPPEVVGATSQGLRRNFFILGGSCRGEKLNATVRPSGGDWLLIQKDGVALPSVRTTWETADGAVLYGEYSGVCDFGEGGYEQALAGRFPDKVGVQFTPRFVTDHPRYAWLNRLQCLGIGEVDLVAFTVSFDLHAVRGGQAPAGAGGR